MKHSIYIDQLTLEHWKGKIDTVDALIISFIQDLDPKNPAICEHMWKGHFFITRNWLLDNLPLLNMSPQAISKHFKKLVELGIVSCRTKTVDGNKKLNHYKLSELFWKIHNKRHEAATEAAQRVKENEAEKRATTVARSDEKARNYGIPTAQPQLRNELIKDSLSTAEAGAQNGAASAAGKKEEPAPSTCADCGEEKRLLDWDGTRICHDCAAIRRDADIAREKLEEVS